MDSKKPEGTEKVATKKKEQPKASGRGRVIKNKTFTRRIDREGKENGTS